MRGSCSLFCCRNSHYIRGEMAYESRDLYGRGRRGRGSYRGRGTRPTGGFVPQEGTQNAETSPRQQTPPPPPPRSQNPLIVADGWQYQDPEGDVHGPFLAAKIANWVDKGFFSEGLPVRKVTPEGMGAWTALKYVERDIRREAALRVVPGEGESAAPVHPVAAAPPPPPAREIVKPKEGVLSPKRSSEVSAHIVNSPESTISGRGPANAFSRSPRSEDASDFGRPRNSWDRRDSRTNRGGRYGNRGGSWNQGRSGGRGFERGNRGFDRGGRGFDRGGRGGRRGGRGGRGRGGPPVDPDLAEAVHKLFSGDVGQGAEQPMWRYIDYEGSTQGPFPSKSMEDWFAGGYLTSTILVCGTVRKLNHIITMFEYTISANFIEYILPHGAKGFVLLVCRSAKFHHLICHHKTSTFLLGH